VGATHAANEIAVAPGQVDMATDFNRNRNAMIEAEMIKRDAAKIIWTTMAARATRPSRPMT
jgi:phosphonate transport system substrate-binding protein